MIDRQEVENLYKLPLKDLIDQAAAAHRQNFDPNSIQISSLQSIKTGGCPENCSYCPQSAHYRTGVNREKLMTFESVIASAKMAQQSGATRFCLGAAWREVHDGEDFETILRMIKGIKSLGLESCCTLGMLTEPQATKLKDAGLDYYNHNIDTSRSHYEKIVSTRTYDDRLRTLATVRRAQINVCTGGIIGLGESDEDRINFLHELIKMDPPPESVTINKLIPIVGTPLEKQSEVSPLELARVIAVARCLIPKARIRLSAGRKTMSDEGQFLCFLAGANSIFFGEVLLTSENPSREQDLKLLSKLGLTLESLPMDSGASS